MPKVESYHSEYHLRFKKTLGKACGYSAERGIEPSLPYLGAESAPKIVELYEICNTLMFEGMHRWYSTIYPGVSAVYAHTNANEAVATLAERWGNSELGHKVTEAVRTRNAEEKVYVLFSSIPSFIKSDGGTHTAFDIALERMGWAMAQVEGGARRGSPVKIDLYCVGNTMSGAGTVTENMVEDVEKDPFGTQAELDAEFVIKVLEEHPNATIVLLGQSWGGAQAVEAARAVEEKLKANENIRLLLMPKNGSKREVSRLQVKADDATPLWGGSELVKGGVKANLADIRDRSLDFMAKIGLFDRKYSTWIVNKKLEIIDSSQKGLKKRCRRALMRALPTGPNPDKDGSIWPKTAKVKLVQSQSDETLNSQVNLRFLRSNIKKHSPHVFFYPRDGGHLIDRFKPTYMRRLGVLVEKIEGKWQARQESLNIALKVKVG